MPISIVVGGQYGSEGKGKVAKFFSEQMNAEAAVRVGGANSGHTIVNSQGLLRVLKILPTAAYSKNTLCFLVPGTYINLKVLFEEIAQTKISDARLKIDPFTPILNNEQILRESNSNRSNSIGSTGCGIAEILIDRISRDKKITFAHDIEELKPYISDTSRELNRILRKNGRVLIEGTQGFGLSLLHSGNYPYVTSRDTTAAGFLSEVGLSPVDVDDIIMVLRTYPIRVGGNSGPLESEISWEVVTKRAGRAGNNQIREYTTVTNRLRRVGEFEVDPVVRAIRANKPTRIVLNHLDYIRPEIRDQYVAEIQAKIGFQIKCIGLSPDNVEHSSRALSIAI